MTGNEFIRSIKNIGKRNRVTVRFVKQRGKGSHGTLYYGAPFTIVRNPKDELKKGTLHAMLAQIGLSITDITGG
jgi:mRNA interferase HicA